jgi:hypothetical protein
MRGVSYDWFENTCERYTVYVRILENMCERGVVGLV